MGALHELTAVEQAAAIRRGEVTSVNLVRHYLDRIGDDPLGAFVTLTPDRALAEAATADRAVAAGADLPPLHGVPIGIKDLAMTAGVRTTLGSAAFADHVPDVDADVVRLLRAAGTISLGKTTTSEFGLSLHAETEVARPARNPWSPEHTAGGSSGGAAVAVAAGLLPVAHGSDGGGSVRIPAAICGLVGYKPSRGLVSGGPNGFGGFGLGVNGVLARTVEDVVAVLGTIAVPQAGEPFPTPAPTPLPDRPLRVGRFVAPMLADAPVDPDCVAAVDRVAGALSAAGHVVEELPGLLDTELAARFDTLWLALTAQIQVPTERVDRLLPFTRWMREAARLVTVQDLFANLTAIQAEVRRVLRSLAGFDLLLCPTLASPQAPIGWFTGAGDPPADLERQKRFSPFCVAYNVTGQPAVSLPVGRTAAGLPVGAMLAAGVGADRLLLRVAASVQEALPWGDAHPALWD